MARSGFEFADLPPVDGLDLRLRKQVVAAIEKLDQIIGERKELQLQEDDLKEKLQILQEQAGLTGFRHGDLCFAAQRVAGKRTLDKMLLMENGCPGYVIEQSYKTGEPSVRRTFRRLGDDDASQT